MAVLDEKNKKKATKRTRKRFEGEEKREKIPVTLYLTENNFKKLQEHYGRKVSQVVDELIAAIVEEF